MNAKEMYHKNTNGRLKKRHPPLVGIGHQSNAGETKKNPLMMDAFVPESEKVKSDKWLINLWNGFAWLFIMNFAYIWLHLNAFMGDFEAMFWFMKENRDMLPKSIQSVSELYFNRDNGVVVNFRNTSYPIELTNWTQFNDTGDNDTNDTANGTILDTNKPTSKSNPKLKYDQKLLEGNIDFSSLYTDY